MKRTVLALVLLSLVLLVLSCGASRRATSRKAIPQWMELPAISSSDTESFFTSDMEIGGRMQRNYSYLYERENLVSSWVAYPLTAENIGGNLKRTNTWGYDPLMPESEQQVLFRGYKEGNHGWYSRGHQIASADRLYSVECNTTTFRFTNMTPQNGDFNGGIWNNLEIKVRNWAKNCDTLYVVTGCVTKDSKYYALDNEGRKVTVPVASYKALLAYRPSGKNAPSHAGYSGCAFFMPHEKDYQDGKVTREMYITIDELETLTGIDFFPLLEKKIGRKEAAAVEAETPSPSWWK